MTEQGDAETSGLSSSGTRTVTLPGREEMRRLLESVDSGAVEGALGPLIPHVLDHLAGNQVAAGGVTVGLTLAVADFVARNPEVGPASAQTKSVVTRMLHGFFPEIARAVVPDADVLAEVLALL